jgi:tocopherol cyclase
MQLYVILLLFPLVPSWLPQSNRVISPLTSGSNSWNNPKQSRLYNNNAASSSRHDPQSTAQTETKTIRLQTPHSGRHFTPSHPAYKKRWWLPRRRIRKRFMEGWYYRLTLPTASFAVIVSIEDPGNDNSKLNLACIQFIGPNNEYLVQADADDTKFWAHKHQLGFGCVFEYTNNTNETYDTTMQPELSCDAWRNTVQSGFQCLPHHLMGRIRGHDGSGGGVLDGQGVPGVCEFDFSVEPVCGWGDTNDTQKRTAGWLANLAVFEPHWQVTMADARATGTITWKNTTFAFRDAPLYAEKNWGAALPSKWYWTQCNSFDGYKQLSVTAGGGIRKIPFGRNEALGMVSVHYNGTFYEGVPWTGAMNWKVATWGKWELSGYGLGRHPFEAVVSYTCDPVTTPGLVFRAPTPDEGMVYFCRDTFEATTTLTLWELSWNSSEKKYIRIEPPLIDGATSSQGGAEIGGGPWWDDWVGESRLKQPIKGLLRLPFKLQALRRRIFSRQT